MNEFPLRVLFPSQAQPAVHVQGQEPLTTSMLAAAPPQEQKQMLGKHRVKINLSKCSPVGV